MKISLERFVASIVCLLAGCLTALAQTPTPTPTRKFAPPAVPPKPMAAQTMRTPTPTPTPVQASGRDSQLPSSRPAQTQIPVRQPSTPSATSTPTPPSRQNMPPNRLGAAAYQQLWPIVDNGNHTFSTGLRLAEVRGDAHSDRQTRNAGWVADNASDFYVFHLRRTVVSFNPPIMRATVTVSNLQPDADFQIRVYTTQSGNSFQLANLPHAGSSSLVLCLSNANPYQGPDPVIELYSTKRGRYSLTVAGNTSSQGCTNVQIPTNNTQN